MTRELDEACAKAMGWYQDAFGGWHRPPHFSELCPHFSTDHETDAEKIAWLRTKSAYVEIGVRANGTALARLHRDITWTPGATMSEALARLVVDVAGGGTDGS
jgi:hypothetical protein